MQKISTMRTSGKNIFEGQLTIGLDLGDRSSAYCVLNEAGENCFRAQIGDYTGSHNVADFKSQEIKQAAASWLRWRSRNR